MMNDVFECSGDVVDVEFCDVKRQDEDKLSNVTPFNINKHLPNINNMIMY